MALTDKLTAIADAIRAKTGGTDALTLDQMATTISTIETGVSIEELVAALEYSGLSLTEDMSASEILEVLREAYPTKTVIFDGTTIKSGYSFTTRKGDDYNSVLATPTIDINKKAVYSNIESCHVNWQALYLLPNVDLARVKKVRAEISFTRVLSGNYGLVFQVGNTSKTLNNTGTTIQVAEIDTSEIIGANTIYIAAYSEAINVGIYVHKLELYY